MVSNSYILLSLDVLSCSQTRDLVSLSTLTASTEWSTSFGADASGLNSAYGWAARSGQLTNWIQAEFDQEHIVTSIRTKGDKDREYTRQFTISTSRDGINWSTIQDKGVDLVFEGNSDYTTIVTNDLPAPIKTRFIRLNVVTFHSLPALRWAIDGCPVM